MIKLELSLGSLSTFQCRTGLTSNLPPDLKVVRNTLLDEECSESYLIILFITFLKSVLDIDKRWDLFISYGGDGNLKPSSSINLLTDVESLVAKMILGLKYNVFGSITPKRIKSQLFIYYFFSISSNKGISELFANTKE